MARLGGPPCRELLKTLTISLPCRSLPDLQTNRFFHSSSVAFRVQAGKYKRTQYKTQALTYEQYYNPSFIGQTKAWNSWNTSNLKWVNTPDQSSKITLYDMFIRKFIYGTWHNMFASEVIIKRRHNIIYIAGIVQQTVPARKMYFLIGYTEEFLGFFLKCPVKMEVQSVPSKKDTVFTYI
jgi:small subunit ribosomal protein S24